MACLLASAVFTTVMAITPPLSGTRFVFIPLVSTLLLGGLLVRMLFRLGIVELSMVKQIRMAAPLVAILMSLLLVFSFSWIYGECVSE